MIKCTIKQARPLNPPIRIAEIMTRKIIVIGKIYFFSPLILGMILFCLSEAVAAQKEPGVLLADDQGNILYSQNKDILLLSIKKEIILLTLKMKIQNQLSFLKTFYTYSLYICIIALRAFSNENF